jgi:4-hydroxybenzoate polyprenyltransferase
MNKKIVTNGIFNYSMLAIDLDNSLVATDTLWESTFLFLKYSFPRFFYLFLWLFRGKSYFKDRLALEVIPEPSLLPYRQDVLEYIDKVRASGIPIILATAANHRIANGVANYLGIFSSVLASDMDINLSGKNKLEAIRAKAGTQPFGYIGDSAIDIPIWDAANTAVLVDPSAGLSKRMKHHSEVMIISKVRWKTKMKAWLRCLRVHQWSKNFLLFIPALMAHRIFELSILKDLILAFISYSLTASSIYIINDILDLEADRQHTTKKNRPLSSGILSIKQALLIVPILLAASFLISFFTLSFLFSIILMLYIIFTAVYSLILKKKVIADVIMLSGLYTFRLIAGGIAVNILVSPWLLVFSMFIFLSLALMKRYTDLLVAEKEANQIKGRGYSTRDLEIVLASGIASGQLSLLVFALYVASDSVSFLYKQPDFLWLIIPCLFYWITRMWLRTHRGKMTDDPIVFTFRDFVSYIIAGIIIIIMLAASKLDNNSLPMLHLLMP